MCVIYIYCGIQYSFYQVTSKVPSVDTASAAAAAAAVATLS